MKKLNKLVEAVVEKTVGRFLPEVEAEATCSSWEFVGCCGPGNSQARSRRYCPGQGFEYICTGLCPA